MAATDDRPAAVAVRRPRRSAGADRLTVVLLSVASFLAVLALLGAEVRTTGPATPNHVVLIRRVYRTTIVETVVGGGTGGRAVTESVSSSGSAAPIAAPATRTS